MGKGEPGQSSLGYIFAATEENPPVIEARVGRQGGARRARSCRALIDPNGFKTHYAFQYLSEAAYQEAGESFAGGHGSAAGRSAAGRRGQRRAVAVTLSGLAPDTAYRFRVVASSHCAPSEPEKVCEDAGEAQSFHTYPARARGLPDDRAWELVSPAREERRAGAAGRPADHQLRAKRMQAGGDLRTLPDAERRRTGTRWSMRELPFAAGEGAAIENEYLARRAADRAGRA